jgi:hypothetical protein
MTDASGNYSFMALAGGGNYTLTPSKAQYPAGTGITTSDVIITQRQYLGVGTPLTGCQLMAADVNLDMAVNTLDVLSVQRFFLGYTTGTGQVGKFKFNPVNLPYLGLITDVSNANFDVLVYGDVASTYLPRPVGSFERATSIGRVAATVALPEAALDQTRSNFPTAVTTKGIAPEDRLIGFQGDFTFDERVVTFQSEPVQKAGLTAGNWNVSGHVLDGPGPIRTLRVSAYSIDTVTPLSGSGTLFQLNMIRVSKAAGGAPLVWAAPPSNFIFLNADLQPQQPGSAAEGRVSDRGSH